MILIHYNLSEKLFPILEKAIRLDGVDMGNIQLFNSVDNTLQIASQIGFTDEVLIHFKIVKRFDTTACGRAAGIGRTVIINDVMQDIGFTQHRDIIKAAGFRSVKSVPIINVNGKLLGIISTHCISPKTNWEMNKIDCVVTELAELIEANI